MAIMTPLFKKLLCVTRVALCKQNITIQMNPLHRQVQQFISISKLIYKEGGFAAYMATNSMATANSIATLRLKMNGQFEQAARLITQTIPVTTT